MHRVPRLAVLTAGAVLACAAPAAAQAPCDPFAATFAGQVPTPKQVLGFDLGKRDVTTAESDRYLAAVDAASARVVSGSLGRSVQGRDLRYAIVGQPDRLSSAGLAAVRADAAKLMDPATSAAEAAAIVANRPAILWIAGNVHGGEESGTDASLRVLQELADRTDCAAQRIRDEAVVVILPTQNPDGREADTRRNAYGFDMNRDWFARTQPETDAKVEMLRRYPPVLFIDAHEMGNTAGYFFPPNADPIYHELTDQAVGWINGLYGPAMQQVFDARKIPYFNYATYDLFYMGYGDTVPATGFGAAGMTFEKTSSDPTHKRVFEQYLTQWTSLSQAAANKDAILRDGATAGSRRKRQGAAGELEPNEVVQPGQHDRAAVPDLTVRQYFLRADEPARAREVQSLVRRLQRMDVRRAAAHRAAGRARLHASTAARRGRRRCRPAPTWSRWPSGRSTGCRRCSTRTRTCPFPYFYDVTAWSQPLLYDVGGGFSGAPVAMATEAVAPRGRAAACPPWARSRRSRCTPCRRTFTRGIESSGWLRWLLDRWGLRVRGGERRGRSRAAPSPATTSCSCRTATPRATCRSRATRTRSRTSGRPARPRSGAGCRAAAATSAGSTAPCSRRRSGSPRRSSPTRAPRASPRRARWSAR